jgi:hypothetical protein
MDDGVIFSNTFMIFPFWKDHALKILKFIQSIITNCNILIPHEIIRNIGKVYMIYEVSSICAWNICTCVAPNCRKKFIEKFSINMDPSIFCNIIHCSSEHCHNIIDNPNGYCRCMVCFKYYCDACVNRNRFYGSRSNYVCGSDCTFRISGYIRC